MYIVMQYERNVFINDHIVKFNRPEISHTCGPTYIDFSRDNLHIVFLRFNRIIINVTFHQIENHLCENVSVLLSLK